MGAARLEVVSGKALGMSILVDDELLIGRHAEGAGRLAEDEEISRSHARLTAGTQGSCAIEDLGSTNGTFVNGLRISAPQTLSEGDTVEVGATTLIVRELAGRDPVPAGTAASPSELPVTAQAAASPRTDPVSPVTDDAREAEPAIPVMSLQLDVDFAAHEARLSVGDSSESVHLVIDAGMWRVVSFPPNEKGRPDELKPDDA